MSHAHPADSSPPSPPPPAVDPVCGMAVDPATAAHKHRHARTTYYFCSAKCLEKFRAGPGRYLKPAAPAPAMAAEPASGGALDPVCGMRVDASTTPYRAHHAGADYFFCSAHCRDSFAANPQRFLAPKRDAAPPASPGTLYTCPMHPEIVQVGPGSCPICGMALEPKDVALVEGENAELNDMRRRFLVGVALTVPVVLLVAAPMTVGLPAFLSPRVSQWLQLVLATPVLLWCGWPFIQRGAASVMTGALNMFTLIALGTGAAYVYSLAAVFLPRLFPLALRDHDGLVEPYFEASAVIVTLVLLGQVLELMARERTGGAIRALLDLAPKMARRIAEDGKESDVPLDAVHVGDRLRVRPGASVPVDGVVLEGSSAVDEALLTGEPLPVEKQPGACVTGGAINRTGSFIMRADKVGADTMLARIVRLVAEAQRSRAPIQRLADRVAGMFVPAVIAVAAATAIVWGIWGPEPRLAYAVINAVAVLIIACPCALGLATPMSIMVGTGRGALAGVLIRDAAALERLEAVDTLVVDKTGTLTEGKPRLVGVVANPGITEDELLRLAASLERASEHPLAEAVVDGASARHLDLGAVADFASLPGKGITGTVSGRRVAIGNQALLRTLGADSGPLDAAANARRSEGETVFYVALDGHTAGFIAVADPIKASAPEAVATLTAEGVRLIMLTGDTRATGEAVARKLGIDAVEAEVLPDQKAAVIRRLQAEGRIVAMAGDGVNDAPALAQADVGIAMGTGADVALESASVTLLKGDLAGLLRARRLSRATLSNIRQNLFFAFVYNVLGVPVAAGVLYPLFGLLLSPIVAAAAMSLSSVSVVGNALRLQRTRL
ncbi:MAG: heavy metal translocating P-type ATPase [Alphaproteobacteria bacterium]|nr:heavy metal translocating P-type ATPase [Alphaproteobacteria bacterium]